MKNEKIARALSLLDDDLITEEDKPVAKKPWRIPAAASALAAAVVVLVLVGGNMWAKNMASSGSSGIPPMGEDPNTGNITATVSPKPQDAPQTGATQTFDPFVNVTTPNPPPKATPSVDRIRGELGEAVLNGNDEESFVLEIVLNEDTDLCLSLSVTDADGKKSMLVLSAETVKPEDLGELVYVKTSKHGGSVTDGSLPTEAGRYYVKVGFVGLVHNGYTLSDTVTVDGIGSIRWK